MLKIIALDTSTKSTGYAIFENEHFIKSGVIRMKSKKMAAPERIALMGRNVLELLNKEKPDIIVCERVSVSRNMNTVRELCRIVDVCYCHSLMNRCRFLEMTPSEWRSALGMQRKKCDRITYKQMAIQFSQDCFGIENPGSDEADAVCIGAAFINDYILINQYRYEIKE